MPEKAKMLVIGGSGFIGARLVASATDAGYEVAYTYLNHSLQLPLKGYRVALDQVTPELQDCLTEFQPQVVVYSAVPPFVYANGEELHRQVSVEGVERTLHLLKQSAPAARFVYLSTNMVFGGGRGLYSELDLPDPELRHDPYRAYGITKYAGEQVALENWADTIVARTSVVYGRDLNSKLYPRVAAMVETLQAGKELVRFRDRYITPTLVDNLVEALLEVVKPDFTYRGVLHLAGSERLTDYDFAVYLAQCLGIDTGLVKSESIADAPVMASSPRDQSIAVDFTQSLLRTRLLDVKEQLISLFN